MNKATATTSLSQAQRQRTLAVILVLAMVLAATFAAYWKSLGAPFIVDDYPSLAPVQSKSLTWNDISEAVFRGRVFGLTRSLTNLTFVLTEYTSGLRPWPYKYQNLMIHLANGLLVFWFLLLIFQVRSGPTRIPAAAIWPAVLAASLWMLHPLQVSTVAYAVQRLVLLSAFFSLLSLIAYLKGRLLLARRPRAGLALIALGLLVLWPLALLCKENAALIAPTLLLVEAALFRFHAADGRLQQLIRFIAVVFFILPLLLGAAVILLKHDAVLSGYIGRDFTLWQRLLSQVHALWLYLQLILFPVPAEMSLFHDGFPVQRVLDLPTALRAGALSLLIGIGIALYRRAPLVSIGILWFFIWHAIESTVIPLELVFEHRNYLALLGPMLLVALGINLLWTRTKLRRLVVFASIGLLAMLTFNTASRASVWSDIDVWMTTQYQNHPKSSRVVEWMVLRSLAHGDQEAAQRYTDELAELVPREAWPLSYSISIQCQQGAVEAELLQGMLSRARTGLIGPAEISSLHRIGDQLKAGSCPGLREEFLLQLSQTVAENPRTHIPHTRVAALNNWGWLAAKAGDFPTAKSVLQESLTLTMKLPKGWLQYTLQTVSDAGAQTGTWEGAADFINEVTSGYRDEIWRERIEIEVRLPKPTERPVDSD